MKVTNKEYKNRIRWTLPQKIDHALGVIDSFFIKYPKSTISFSGGIDSTVMLHLARVVDKKKIAVFVNTTNEFSEILKFVRNTENIKIVRPNITFIEVIDKHGFPLISKMTARMLLDLRNPTVRNQATRNLWLTGIKKDGTKVPNMKLPNKYRYLIHAPFDITNKCCKFLKTDPIKPFQKEGMLVGTMAIDSLIRKHSYLKTGCINFSTNKATPLAIWTKEDVWKYIKQNNIEYCSIYDKGETSTGCTYCAFGIMFDKTRFERLRKREPKRYKQMMELTNNGVTYEEALQTVLRGTLTKSLFTI